MLGKSSCYCLPVCSWPTASNSSPGRSRKERNRGEVEILLMGKQCLTLFFLTHVHHCCWDSMRASTLIEPQALGPPSSSCLFCHLDALSSKASYQSTCHVLGLLYPVPGCCWPFSRCWQLILFPPVMWVTQHLHMWIP